MRLPTRQISSVWLTLGYILSAFVGLALAGVAFCTGSVGPEPPRTELGTFLASFYNPYYMFFLDLLGPLGILLGFLLSGIVLCYIFHLAYKAFAPSPSPAMPDGEKKN